MHLTMEAGVQIRGGGGSGWPIVVVRHVGEHWPVAGVQSQKAVTAYFSSTQLLPFGFAKESSWRIANIFQDYTIHGADH